MAGFNLGLFLVSAAGLLTAALMLRDRAFSRSTAILGILAHGLALADYLRQALTSLVFLALLVILPNAIFLVIWYALVGRGLSRLAQGK